ncbi:MAG: DUF2812 domain-containing protein [Chloroflexi bacterium]|nr:MAG: DUF2812 domain-containing protein [Chloroflexota bacterium]
MNKPTMRYEPSQGFAFDGAGDMQRLSTLATEGWRLIGFNGLSYVLESAPPDQLIFALDYMYEPDEEYFALCRASGWEHIVTMDGLIHIFKAALGTPSMFSTAESKQKYQRVHRRLLVPVLVVTVVTMLVWWVLVEWGQSWRTQLEPQWLLLVGTLGMFGVAVAVQTLFICTFMPWLAYRLRGWRGPGQVVQSSMRIVISLVTVAAFLWLIVW